MGISMSVFIKKINGYIVFMPEIFKNVSCNFDEYSISFNYDKNNFNVVIESDVLSQKEEEKIFWNFYNYLGFILGYFPCIKKADFADEEYLANIVEQYKTKECFIRNSEHYIKNISNEQFKSSFAKFIGINNKAEFQLSIMNISMMESNHYPEIALINLLQSLDGLYEQLITNKDVKRVVNNNKLNYLKNTLNEIVIEDSNNEDINKIIDTMEKIKEISFYDKLYYLLSSNSFGIFDYEKSQDKENKYSFENIIRKSVNTRNKFSHSVNKSKTFNGLEASVYIFKFIMLYRIIIFEKIGLIDLIDKDEFKKNLKEWDTYIQDTLKEDNNV